MDVRRRRRSRGTERRVRGEQRAVPRDARFVRRVRDGDQRGFRRGGGVRAGGGRIAPSRDARRFMRGFRARFGKRRRRRRRVRAIDDGAKMRHEGIAGRGDVERVVALARLCARRQKRREERQAEEKSLRRGRVRGGWIFRATRPEARRERRRGVLRRGDDRGRHRGGVRGDGDESSEEDEIRRERLDASRGSQRAVVRGGERRRQEKTPGGRRRRERRIRRRRRRRRGVRVRRARVRRDGGGEPSRDTDAPRGSSRGRARTALVRDHRVRRGVRGRGSEGAGGGAEVTRVAQVEIGTPRAVPPSPDDGRRVARVARKLREFGAGRRRARGLRGERDRGGVSRGGGGRGVLLLVAVRRAEAPRVIARRPRRRRA